MPSPEETGTGGKPAAGFEIDAQDLSAESRAALDLIRARRGAVPPMFNVLIASPEIAIRMEELSTRLWHCGLPRAGLEAVFLMVARKFDCSGQWRRHEARALASGVSHACIEDLRRDVIPAGDGALQLMCRMTGVLLAGGSVEKSVHEAAEHSLGKPGLADLCTFIGMASIVSMTINLQGHD